jgi:hypothetical protein
MFKRLASWWRAWLMPSWLSSFLMLLGCAYLGECVGDWRNIWRIELLVVALIIAWLGQRRIKKVMLLERTPTSITWRLEYKRKDDIAPDV